ncbi:diacylglycerol kinase family protein [Colwellia piezophila]|uniref:diacylglycerol kinase family protein n=1 Tax=Colwellia piezophila TaxID=211668 RepID=UPI0003A4F4DF|nr:diacylglycerol kinase family protein [Colwellia piezophila]
MITPCDINHLGKGDVARLVKEARDEGCQRLIVGGGDGTVKEIVEALMHQSFRGRLELAILPLGTANDFATACTIPSDFFSALRLAQQGKPSLVNCVKANEHFLLMLLVAVLVNM